MSTVGSRIKKAREDAGLTQTQLGAACGLSRAAVSQWESGSTKAPTAENIFAIADATGFSARWLATGKGPEKLNATQPPKLVSPQVKELLQIMDGLGKPGWHRVLATAHEEADKEVAAKQLAGSK